MPPIYFTVRSKLGVKIRTTVDYWNFIVTSKHQTMAGKEGRVKQTLKEPDEIRRSRQDSKVFLYNKKIGKYYTVVVCKHLNGDGYIITTYNADKIKAGEIIWKRQK
jgi:hypothetical protein